VISTADKRVIISHNSWFEKDLWRVCSRFEVNFWPSIDSILNENLMVKPAINPTNTECNLSVLKASRRQDSLDCPTTFG
jgi:hypothetical protein